MNLLIDIGNSRLKWAWSDKTLWESGAVAIDNHSANHLMQTIGEPHGAPLQVGVVSVASEELLHGITQAAQEKWGASVISMQSQLHQAGVRNGYDDPKQLGNDRWVALIAARTQTQSPVCVLSCGTAITIDAMNEHGEFIGGTIFPGLELLRRSLRHGTVGIDHTDGKNESCQAASTVGAVMGGTLYGLAGAINRIVAEHRRVLGGKCAYIATGGSAEVLAPLLDFPVQIVPDLILHGIKQIMEEQK